MTVTCKTVTATTAATPANITAYLIGDPSPASGDVPLNVKIGVQWKNTGGTSGTFYPRVDVSGTKISPSSSGGALYGDSYTETLAAGAIGASYFFFFTISTASTVTICPVPN